MSRRPNFQGFPASSAALPRVIKHGRSKDFSKGGQTVTIVMIRPQLRPCRVSITSKSVWKDYISQVMEIFTYVVALRDLVRFS